MPKSISIKVEKEIAAYILSSYVISMRAIPIGFFNMRTQSELRRIISEQSKNIMFTENAYTSLAETLELYFTANKDPFVDAKVGNYSFPKAIKFLLDTYREAHK